MFFSEDALPTCLAGGGLTVFCLPELSLYNLDTSINISVWAIELQNRLAGIFLATLLHVPHWAFRKEGESAQVNSGW